MEINLELLQQLPAEQTETGLCTDTNCGAATCVLTVCGASASICAATQGQT